MDLSNPKLGDILNNLETPTLRIAADTESFSRDAQMAFPLAALHSAFNSAHDPREISRFAQLITSIISSSAKPLFYTAMNQMIVGANAQQSEGQAAGLTLSNNMVAQLYGLQKLFMTLRLASAEQLESGVFLLGYNVQHGISFETQCNVEEQWSSSVVLREMSEFYELGAECCTVLTLLNLTLINSIFTNSNAQITSADQMVVNWRGFLEELEDDGYVDSDSEEDGDDERVHDSRNDERSESGIIQRAHDERVHDSRNNERSESGIIQRVHDSRSNERVEHNVRDDRNERS